MPGKLYLCATPIGNLKDITLRVLETLKTVDLIAAEDTRHTGKLLNHFQIKKPLVSFHDQNELKILPRLMNELKTGKTVAQVSDAGLPGIADPGHRLVGACIEAGIPFEVLPGPSAMLTAAVLSGLPTDDIRFLGFLPRKSGARRRLLADTAGGRSTLVWYESPHRLKQTLADISDVFGDRRLFIGRELTKLYEEHLRGTAAQILASMGEDQAIKGEIVIVVGGRRDRREIDARDIKGLIDEKIARGMSKSEAVKDVAGELNLSKRELYNLAHPKEPRRQET